MDELVQYHESNVCSKTWSSRKVPPPLGDNSELAIADPCRSAGPALKQHIVIRRAHVKCGTCRVLMELHLLLLLLLGCRMMMVSATGSWSLPR